jgi:hypothetical protein
VYGTYGVFCRSASSLSSLFNCLSNHFKTMLIGSVDGLALSDMLIKAGSYVLCCLCWWVFFHHEVKSGSLNPDRFRLCSFKTLLTNNGNDQFINSNTSASSGDQWRTPRQSDQFSTSSPCAVRRSRRQDILSIGVGPYVFAHSSKLVFRSRGYVGGLWLYESSPRNNG